MPISEVLKKAIETYGKGPQTLKCIEESGELLQAIAKYQFSNGTENEREALDHLQEEIADCCIMLEQMKMMYGEKEIDEKIIEKANRLADRLEK